ncbi:hypothetical protein [Streptomyces sp. NPDC089919]|uniref:hypothetical protein n=1 Tax=Streptomyces sp. NPDC089919 TaxID=3155188 RepID=UPI003425D538
MGLRVEQVAGYAERELDGDLARWFAGAPRAAVPARVRPVEPFLARLPQAAATALAALDLRVRTGALPAALGIEDWSYAFEFEANGCQVLDTDYATELPDADVWSVGADGSGNYFVVLTDGRVAVWFHEEEVIEAGTHFDDLDVFLWTIVRYHAVKAGVLTLAEIEQDLRDLAQPGVLAPDIGLLASLA